MITIVAHNHIKEGCEEAYQKLAKEMVTASRSEEGNISYRLMRDRNDPLHFAFIEVWKDEEAIRLHNESTHFKTLVPKMDEYKSVPSDAAQFEEAE